MKKNYIKTVMALVAFPVLFFAGCSPEELELAIKSSVINKAASGTYGMANATITFEVETDDIKSKLPKIRAAVMPYLGKDGKMTVRGDKITAKFKVPVVTDSYHGSLPEKPLAKLVIKDDLLKFEPTSQLDALNRTLSDIDFSLDVDFKAKHVVFKIIGDSDSKCKVSATAVFIDGEAKVNYTAEVGNDDSVDIEFRCDNEASVYHQIQPFIGIGKLGKQFDAAQRILASRASASVKSPIQAQMEKDVAVLLQKAKINGATTFELKGFYLGMSIGEAKKLVEYYLPDAQIEITKDNNLAIDKPEEIFDDKLYRMYFCQADKSGKVYRFNFDKRFLKKWFHYDVQTYKEWAYKFGREYQCDFRYNKVEASRDMKTTIPLTVKQDSYRYLNNLKGYKITYFGKKEVFDPTKGEVFADAGDVGFSAGSQGLVGEVPDDFTVARSAMWLTGYRMAIRAWTESGYENGEGAKEGTLRVEALED